MRYLHTMLRVRDLDAALDFYCNKLGLNEMRRRVDEKNKYTLVFLAAPGDAELVAKGPAGRAAPLVELTYNWNAEDYGEARYFGHLAYEVDDIYALCERMMKAGVTINRPPRDGMMAFVRSPDRHRSNCCRKARRCRRRSRGCRCPIPGTGNGPASTAFKSTTTSCLPHEHDPEKWKPVFRKDHAPSKHLSAIASIAL